MMNKTTRFASLFGGVALAIGTYTAGSAAAMPAPEPGTTEITTQVACDYTSKRPEISYGSSGTAVRQAQCLLRTKWGYKDVKVDGDFGSITKKYVKKRQANCRIAVDGIVGPQTWWALYHPKLHCGNGSDPT